MRLIRYFESFLSNIRKKDIYEKILSKNYTEEKLVKAICNGKIKFHKEYVNRWAKMGFVSKLGLFKLYTESSSIGESFPYFLVRHKDIEKANHPRIQIAINEKKDIGNDSHYSWI